jgi:hypothetical protein
LSRFLGCPPTRGTVTHQDATDLDRLLQFVNEHTAPVEPIFAAAYAPMLYYLADRPNPTRYDLLLPGSASSKKCHDELIETLEGAGVRVVVIRDVAWDGREDRRFLNYAEGIADWLDRAYPAPERIGDWLVFAKPRAR